MQPLRSPVLVAVGHVLYAHDVVDELFKARSWIEVAVVDKSIGLKNLWCKGCNCVIYICTITYHIEIVLLGRV